MQGSGGSPRVCVIGAGAAGLTTMKQLKDQGISNIDCFEKENAVGGIFLYGEHKNGVYDNATLTISNYLMAFSDMPPTGHRYHWHHSEYYEYLQEYARKFDLLRHVTFRTSVLCVEGEPGKWHVVVQTSGAEPVDMGYYDVVAVCSGTHQAEHIPNIPGIEGFTGKMLHSGEYKNNARFAGKDCVVVGIGESAADVVREISDVSSSTTLAIRSYPYLIPRLARPFHKNPYGASSDAYTSHLRHDLLKVPLCRSGRLKHFINRLMCTLAAILYYFFPSLGQDKKPTKDAFNQDVDGGFVDKDTKASFLANKVILTFCDLSGQQEKGQKFACKNVSFVPNIVSGKIAVNSAGIKCVEGEYVVFNDGSRARAEYLVMCTGYRDSFSYLKGNIGATGIPLSVPENNVRRLYRHIFHPCIGHSMAWIGFVRPSTGGIPPCAEMAARYFALLVAGKRKLPRAIADLTQSDYSLDTHYFRLSPNVKTLVGYKHWMDTMAEDVGCEVQLWRYLLRPRLFVRLCIGSLVPSQYRLVGPGSMPELAKDTVLGLPVAPTGEQTIGEAYRSWLRHLNPRKMFVRNE
mmetsp:Transcript_64211/g.165278  ORF Transcript_64211/g.165278 Transcript_64211/m.165278 type:complete len:574 (+) Transcript_64211:60-1781(+)